MDASKLDQRITIVEPINTPSPMGGSVQSESIRGRVWASLRYLKGREFIEANARNSRSEAVLTVRASSLTKSIKPHWLIKHDFRTWEVLGDPIPMPAGRPVKYEITVTSKA